MDDKFYIQGEYIVRKNYSSPDEEKINEMEDELLFFINKYNDEEIDIPDLFEELTDYYNCCEIYEGNDYTESDTIYRLFMDNNDCYLLNVSYPEYREVIRTSKNNLDKNYITLREFIKTSKFIGSEGYIINPKFVDLYELDQNNTCILLFANKNGILAKVDGQITFLDERYVNSSWIISENKKFKDDHQTLKKLKLQIKNSWKEQLGSENDDN